jgi:hypothetical protein
MELGFQVEESRLSGTFKVSKNIVDCESAITAIIRHFHRDMKFISPVAHGPHGYNDAAPTWIDGISQYQLTVETISSSGVLVRINL